MPIHLLRGINVGGHKKIPMTLLRSCYEKLGLAEIRTYIQSGNVVFEGAIDNAVLEQSIQKETGFEVPGMLFTNEEWQEIMDHAPEAFKTNRKDLKLYITLLQQEPSSEAVERLSSKLSSEEVLSHYKRALFLHYPSDLKKPFFTNVAVEKTLGQAGTTRNWNTMNALLKMIQE